MDMPTPEEIVRGLAAGADLHRMEQEHKAANIYSLFAELSQDHLVGLANMLTAISEANNPRASAAFFEGFASASIESRFDVCAIHGVNHDVEALASLANVSTETRDDVEPVNPQEPLLMEKYRLVRNGDLFMCADCGIRYPSLQDRMLKAPDDCHGCHDKSAHG